MQWWCDKKMKKDGMEIILRQKWGYKCGGGEASKWIFLIEHPPASNSFLKHVKLWSAFYHHRLHNIPSNEFQNMVKPGIVEGHQISQCLQEIEKKCINNRCEFEKYNLIRRQISFGFQFKKYIVYTILRKYSIVRPL